LASRQEIFEKMVGVGDPAVPSEQSGDPAQTHQPATSGESKPDLVFGKYKDLDAAAQGFSAQQDHINRLQDENRTFRDLLAQVASGTKPQAKSATEELQEMGIPAQTIHRLIQEIAGPIAKETAKAEIAPVLSTQAADQYMARHYPAYSALERDIVSFVQSDPEVRQVVEGMLRAGDITTARVTAFERFRMANGDQVDAQLRTLEGDTRQEALMAKRQASLIPGQRGRTAAPSNTQQDDKQRNARIANAVARGDHRQYFAETLGPGVRAQLRRRGMEEYI
jgi:hypothetical protein